MFVRYCYTILHLFVLISYKTLSGFVQEIDKLIRINCYSVTLVSSFVGFELLFGDLLHMTSDVNKDHICNDKDQSFRNKDKDKN